MSPFGNLIHDLGVQMGVELHSDSHESCRIFFSEEEPTIQIDLDANGERILIGSELGALTAGVYRERIFRLALQVNGTSTLTRGYIGFSEKNDLLILFQFLQLDVLTAEKLHKFIQLFLEHARVWKMAIGRGDLPQVEMGSNASGSGMFGL